MTARPIVKWVGGKTKLLPDLVQRLPTTYGRYYEPFIGGAALFFRLAPERAVINDLNADLVGLYRAIAADVEAVIRFLRYQTEAHDEAHYHAVKKQWNAVPVAGWQPADRAAAFLYLNKACFNGLYRVNGKGEFNVAWGKHATIAFDLDNLRAASAALQRADIRCGDYRDAVHDAGAGDLVYFDSPYDVAPGSSAFTAYTSSGFGPEEQRDLADLARSLTERGVHVLLSNSDTPFVRELYDWARVDTVRCARAVNCNGAGRGEVNEVIAVGDPAVAMRAPRRVRRMQLSLAAVS
jgi:DNA adenine methylase